ncbi:MAG: hypothetical protein EZS28_015601 [Streblomastix strix]|uniref:Uncharacterized protein n=1 Tax=Streblomastix strix TaxID=222440 RepID=A0A5J4W2D8_9EUKA|nr:MAG: hypothetical protein EZS28_015601 [Streblomastix strix]
MIKSRYIELLANLFDGVKGFKQQVGITPSMHLVQGALYLLYRLIHGSDYLCCVAEEHAGVIESLVALSKFQRQRVEDQKTHFLTIDIRETADKCLIEIWNNNGQDDKQNMINDLRFVQLIIERMSTCGESEEESERIRLKVLEMFESVLFQTHEGYYLFPEFPALQKSVDEGIEDAGGIEEFESLIFIVDHWNLEELVLESKTIKEVISNGMIEYFNQISRNIINSPYS